MQDRHWTKLQQELGVLLPVGPAFTLQTLFDLKVRADRQQWAARHAMRRSSAQTQRDLKINIMHHQLMQLVLLFPCWDLSCHTLL